MFTRRDSFALAAAGAVAATGAVATPAAASNLNTMRDERLDRAFTASGCVGVAAAVIGRDGIEWQGVRGNRKLGEAQAVTTQDLWHLGSNTKAITAALWARLVEQGAVQWGMTLPQALAAGGVNLAIDPAWNTVTVEQLLRHRGGIDDGRVLGPAWLMTARHDPRPLPQQRRTLMAALLEAAPDGKTGQFEYGNANYILVGALIEAVTGLSWEEAMQQQVFAPLGMKSAGFGAPRGPLAVWGHGGEGALRRPVDPSGAGSDNPLALGPAGTVHMSMSDYGRFISTLLDGGGTWLSAANVRHLFEAPQGENYALGWIRPSSSVIGQGWAQGDLFAHDGSNTLWYCSLLGDRGAGRAWLALASDGNAGARFAPSLALDLARLQVG